MSYSTRDVTRREIMRTATSGAIGLGVLATVNPATASDPSETPFIDCHSHIWTPDVRSYPLAKGKAKDNLDPPSFTTAELLKVARANGVGKVVLIQHQIFYGWDNSYMIDAAEQHRGVFSVVGMVDDRKPHPDAAMRKLLKKHVRGFRITPRIYGKDKWLDGPGMAAMWKCGAETGQAMCCLIDPEDLPSVDRMCTRFPDTPVVIDHFARIGVDGKIREADLKRLCRLAKFKHTFAKISAFYALGKKKPPYHDLVPMIRRVLDAFGPERCMWGSDSPYQLVDGHTYKASIALVRDHLDFLSAADRQHLLRRTAEKVFFG